MITITNVQFYFTIVLNALFTGIGTAIGTYIANKHLIEKVGKLKKKLDKKVNK